MKHTKGPWILENLAGHRFAILKEDAGGGNTMIATLSTSDGNARLIASAPEMLEVLEFLFANISTDEMQRLENVRANFVKMQDVIAKAKGE